VRFNTLTGLCILGSVLGASPLNMVAQPVPLVAVRPMPQSFAQRITPLADLLSKGEGNWNSVNRGYAGDTPGGIKSVTGKNFDQMTIGQVMRMQRHSIYAVGRYQFIPTTLRSVYLRAGLSLRDKFTPETGIGWKISTFAGRFGEISSDPAGAPLTLVFRLVLESQKQGEPVAWITSLGSTFFPPDAADIGVDLSAMAVIRVPEFLSAARATEHLLRSGSFGIVVMDVGPNAHLPLHAQSRLAGLARKHDTALLCITEKESDQPSVGSLISLRVHSEKTQGKEDVYRCAANVLKDKRHGPGWGHIEVCRGPDGLH